MTKEGTPSNPPYRHSEDDSSAVPQHTYIGRMAGSLFLPVPQSNVCAYKIIYSIETATRMLILTELEKISGPRWYRKCLPSDVLSSYKQARTEERKTTWLTLVPHEPIAYVDFPDLKKIIMRSDNWSNVFATIFGKSKKDLFSATWSKMEPIRNKVAHNRIVAESEIVTLRDSYNFLSENIGRDYLNALLTLSRDKPNIPQMLHRLKNEGQSALETIRHSAPLEEPSIWPLVESSWWFDETYIGENLEAISDYFETVMGYTKLLRRRGNGHLIEKWSNDHSIYGQFSASDQRLSDLLQRSSTGGTEPWPA